MLNNAIRDTAWMLLAPLLISSALQGCATQSGLDEHAKAVTREATKVDRIGNGCFVIRQNNSEYITQKETVVCPIIDKNG